VKLVYVNPGAFAVAQAISVHNVSKSFGVKVVDDVSFAVEAGEAVGIVGPNGAGKTTLLNLVAGDLAPDSGTIWLNGADVTRRRANARCRAGIGRTSQIPRPFEGLSVFENVLVGATFGQSDLLRRSERVQRAHDALQQTGLLGKANTEAGSLTLLDRKRLELSRALATAPSVLLLDEIAGGLTEPEVAELVDLVKSIHSDGITVIWIEHIVHALVAVVGRIVAIAEGRKIAEGPPAEVMSSEQVRAVYLGNIDE